MLTFIRIALTALLAPVVIMLGATHAKAVPAPPAAAVGEATLVIGVARIVTPDGSIRTIERGGQIYVGDRVETGSGGHVHVRFADGARVSVRPSSRLQIVNYQYSEQTPALTAIKFRLDEGVVRSITGNWGEAARDKFRLNTPLAAIGVKGTDFIVNANSDNTQATVYTGAIIVTPLDGGCQNSLGPCQNGHEKLLSADMKGQMLVLGRGQASPLVQSDVRQLASNAAKSEPVRADSAIDKTTVLASADSKPSGAIVGGVPRPLDNQLIWARLAPVAAEGDMLSRAFTDAHLEGRQGIIGNGAFTLFRLAPAGTEGTLTSADTTAIFRLDGAAAQIHIAGTERGFNEPVRVDNASLSVNFARSTYATQFNMSNPRIGSENIGVSGTIQPNGILRGTEGNAFMAGALSLDGREAAYFFEKTLPAGQVSGITLWGR